MMSDDKDSYPSDEESRAQGYGGDVLYSKQDSAEGLSIMANNLEWTERAGSEKHETVYAPRVRDIEEEGEATAKQFGADMSAFVEEQVSETEQFSTAPKSLGVAVLTEQYEKDERSHLRETETEEVLPTKTVATSREKYEQVVSGSYETADDSNLPECDTEEESKSEATEQFGSNIRAAFFRTVTFGRIHKDNTIDKDHVPKEDLASSAALELDQGNEEPSDLAQRDEELGNVGGDVDTTPATPDATAPPRSADQPRQTTSPQSPGAFRVFGDRRSQFVEGDITTVTDPHEDMSTIPSVVSARLVDEEEERRMRARIEESAREDILQHAAVGQVVVKDKILVYLDNLVCGARGWRLVVVSATVLAVIVGAAVAMALLLPREPSTPAPTQPPARTEQDLRELLSSVSSDNGAALNMTGSPQHKAFRWLVNSINLPRFSSEQIVQRYGLATLYFSTDGGNWYKQTNWIDDGHECGRWVQGSGEPLRCSDSGAVLGLDLNSNGLYGTIPPEIGLFSSSLKLLGLSYNSLSGEIPSELFSLTELTALGLCCNPLNGTVPAEITLLTSLMELNWSQAITSDMSALTGLTHLDLCGCFGRCDPYFGDCYGSDASSTIPDEIAVFTNLEHLSVSSNQFTGPIPSELFLLSKLQSLDASFNQLGGPVPTEVGLLSDLELLWLDVNLLIGTIPTEVGLLTALESLSFSGNNLTRGIPSELFSLTKLSDLGLGNMQISGPVPTEIAALTALEGLDLSSNSLTGTLPSELRSLTKLVHLFLSDNHLSGPVPSSLTGLEILVIDKNQLNGPIPTEMGLSTKLAYLSLASNMLSGTIPSEIGALANLNSLDLRNNSLTGTIPTVYAQPMVFGSL